MSKQLSVTIHLRVWDEKAFRKAAYEQALKEGVGEGFASLYKKKGEMSLSECASMIFDPGMGPDGCEILESECQE